MSDYTPEQVEQVIADIRSHPITVSEKADVISLLTDYAATLRQQGEPAVAVSDEVVDAAARVLCAYESRECNVDKDDNWNLYAEDFKAQARPVVEAVAPLLRAPAGSAALAQNTQGDAESVGSVYTMEPLVPGGEAKCHAMLTRALPAGTKLYTHAERATVPDVFMRLLDVSRRVPDWAGEEIPEGCCSDTEFSMAIEDVDEYLAAAPSQPEDADPRTGFMPNGTRATWQDNLGRERPCTITGWHAETYDAELDDGINADGYARGRFATLPKESRP